jgi:drug/metabolite transporter (DMT)-like permease
MPAQNSKNKRVQSYLLLLINTIVWGAAFVIVKPAFDVTTPLRFLFYRHLIAAMLTLPLFWYYRQELLRLGKTYWTIVVLELIGSPLALVLFYTGLKYTTVLEASLLSTSLPVFIILGGILILREKQERHEWVGMGLTFVATLFLTVWPSFATGRETAQVLTVGNVLIIASHLANLVYFPLAKRAYQKIPKFLVTTISFWVAAITFFGLSLAEAANLSTPLMSLVNLDLQASSVWVASGYMAVFGSIIGLTAYIKGQDNIEASEASLFYYLQPLVYLPLTYLAFGESLTISQFIALLVILFGVFWAERRTKPSPLAKRSNRPSKKS